MHRGVVVLDTTVHAARLPGCRVQSSDLRSSATESDWVRTDGSRYSAVERGGDGAAGAATPVTEAADGAGSGPVGGDQRDTRLASTASATPAWLGDSSPT